MKRTFLAIVAAMIIAVSASAQRLTDVTAEARLITDKMVLELGLNNIQRNSILQLNINYLNGITSYRDIDADGWKYRNKQLKKLLTSKQWKLYKDAYYFYRPISGATVLMFTTSTPSIRRQTIVLMVLDHSTTTEMPSRTTSVTSLVSAKESESSATIVQRQSVCVRR